MNKRFALTTAGIAVAAVGSAASAELVNVTFQMDNYPGEASFYITDSSGALVASEVAWAGVTAGSAGGFLSSSYGSTGLQSGVFTTVFMDLDAGTYDVLMTDQFQDGWNDTGYGGLTDGSNAFTNNTTGEVVGFTGGASQTATITVVPAPGALALLGLAGLATRRKRK
jgi:hypothetical protein